MLRLDLLTKVFAARTGSVRAVDAVSFSVDRGELVSLLGPSGCGKTTTLRLIAGFETATSGSIELAGRDVSRLPPQKRETGMVFQNYALFPHLDVFENVAFGLRTRGGSRSDIDSRVNRALGLVDLDGYGARRVQELSGGQQQRVALARALAPEPPLLLLDEPLSNLDASLRERTRVELRSLLKQLGMTAVFVTHDQDEAFALADRIALLERGRLQQYGTPDELYRHPANPFVAGFIGRANFMAATLAGTDPVRVMLPGGVTWPAEPAPGLAAEIGDVVSLMVRPESLVLSRAADGLHGTVREKRFAGAFTVVMIDIDDVQLTVHAHSADVDVGDPVTIEPAGPVLVFPANAALPG